MLLGHVGIDVVVDNPYSSVCRCKGYSNFTINTCRVIYRTACMPAAQSKKVYVLRDSFAGNKIIQPDFNSHPCLCLHLSIAVIPLSNNHQPCCRIPHLLEPWTTKLNLHMMALSSTNQDIVLNTPWSGYACLYPMAHQNSPQLPLQQETPNML